MPAKSHQSTAIVGKAPSATRAKRIVARAQVVEAPRPEIDQQWEQIRVRGEQISADIKGLLARLS